MSTDFCANLLSRHMVAEAHIHISKKASHFMSVLRNLNEKVIWLGGYNIYCHDPNMSEKLVSLMVSPQKKPPHIFHELICTEKAEGNN